MSKRVTSALATTAWWAMACNIVDDQPTPTTVGDTGASSLSEECTQRFEALIASGCPPGSLPQVHQDGGTSKVLLIDDPAAQAGLGVGLVVHFGANADADWVGYHIYQNGDCTVGCFLPQCAEGQNGCFASWLSGGICSHYCTSDPIDQLACDELQQACLDAEAEHGPGGSTGDDDGGLDDTGGGDAETTGGIMLDEPYDCTLWNPQAVLPPEPGGPLLVPQALVDQLVLANADPLTACDGVRLRQGIGGHWTISRMRHPGLLGALGLQVGDQLESLDGLALDSLHALARVLSTFVTEDGRPRRFAASHPGFVLGVRRDQQRVTIELRIAP
jgi:hypothetical protein